MQITFVKELIIILKVKWSSVEGKYKSKNIDNFSLNQNIEFICR